MKRRESYKTAAASSDLASFTLTSNLNSSLVESSHLNSKPVNSIDISGATTTSTALLNSTNSKLKLKEICISMPVAKPSINELNQQLSVENKQIKSAKTLIER